jgi:hypothetical protein
VEFCMKIQDISFSYYFFDICMLFLPERKIKNSLCGDHVFRTSVCDLVAASEPFNIFLF